MDGELKAKLDAIESKLDSAIAHQEDICKLKHSPIDKHLSEAPKFRDKLVANGIWIVACWSVVLLILGRTLYIALLK